MHHCGSQEEDVIQIVQSQLKKVGIERTIQNVDYATHIFREASRMSMAECHGHGSRSDLNGKEQEMLASDPLLSALERRTQAWPE
jgi:ABC-type transport system substrate-binding protein